jgi:hypothetical protein
MSNAYETRTPYLWVVRSFPILHRRNALGLSFRLLEVSSRACSKPLVMAILPALASCQWAAIDRANHGRTAANAVILPHWLVDASLPWLPRFLSAIRPLRLANTGLLTRGVVPQRQRRSAHNLGQEEWDKDTPPYGANALPVANAAWKRLVIPSEGTPTILMQKNRVLLFRAVQKFPRGGTADRGRQPVTRRVSRRHPTRRGDP